jgi:hypothetical protein
MTDVQIKVNTYNRLRKIRQGIVYGNIETVLDELLQNCQRSFKVSKTETPVIDVVVGKDYFIIRDNGSGCEDPQSIFEFEKSGWDIQSAFGQGGSESIFQIADVFIIRSHGWQCTVDVNQILETENLKVDVDEMPYLAGYEIYGSGEKIAGNIELIASYLSETLSHYPYTCYINGKVLEYTPLLTVSSEYKLGFNNEMYEAILGVQSGWRDCEVFFEKRKVTDIWVRGITGKIELKEGAVNLKAPDRKSIIRDELHRKLENQLIEDATHVYKEFISSEPDSKAFEKYADYIDEYLTPKDYIDYLPDFEAIAKVPVANQVIVDNDFFEEPQKSSCHSGETVFDETVSQDKTKSYPKFLKNKKLINSVWVESRKKDELLELIAKAHELEVHVYYSWNKLTDKAYEYLRVPYIEDVFKKTVSSYVINRVSTKDDDVTYKEARLLNVLRCIEESFDLKDVFRIGDIKEHILVEDGERTLIDKLAKKSSATMKDRNRIYLDRKSLNLGKVDVIKSKANITKFDVLVVMLNIQTIASGLAILVYNTVEGTVDHYNKIDKISKEIGLLLSSL